MLFIWQYFTNKINFRIKIMKNSSEAAFETANQWVEIASTYKTITGTCFK